VPPLTDEKASVSPDAPDKPEGPNGGAPTITKQVNEVNVVFTVTDRHNRYVKDLTKSDFKVIDDEKPIEKMNSFRREADLPLQVGLLIDASGSIRERFKFEQESAIEFLNETLRPHFDKAFVLGFDSSLEMTQDFTDSTESLSKGIRSLRPGNATRLYDAVYYACREKLLQSAQSDSVRRAIILVSDGDDNASHVTREEAIEMALRADVIIYTISTNYAGMGDTDKNDKILERISDATGGRTFRPFQPQDVANAFAQIQDDLRSQYALSYHPADFMHDGRYRTIEIMADHKGLKVRSRHGYYAPAQ
jgi:VWFA-related protein